MTQLDDALAQIDALLLELDKSPENADATHLTNVTRESDKQSEKVSKKDKKVDRAKAKNASAASTAFAKPARPDSSADPFTKANLRVARVLEVECVENSEKLYKLKVDTGAGNVQVIAGLRQYISQDEMQQRSVVTVLNLKPAKLAGQLSEAMILAADCALPDGSVVVATLQPPAEAQPGDAVYLEGSEPPESTPKTCKKEHWSQVVEQLGTKCFQPTYRGIPLCCSSGMITVPDKIPDGSGIH